jgi:hypothetical protein
MSKLKFCKGIGQRRSPLKVGSQGEIGRFYILPSSSTAAVQKSANSRIKWLHLCICR